METKTVLQHFIDEIKDREILRLAISNTPPAKLISKEQYFYQAIASFNWDKSQEGYKFWNRVAADKSVSFDCVKQLIDKSPFLAKECFAEAQEKHNVYIGNPDRITVDAMRLYADKMSTAFGIWMKDIFSISECSDVNRLFERFKRDHNL